MTESLPEKPEEQPEAWPVEYWPDSEHRSMVTDADLRSIIHDIAYTAESVTKITERHQVGAANFYRLRAKLPRLREAYALAMELRQERTDEEIMEIADEPLPEEKEQAQLELAHRRLRIDARSKVSKSRAKSMEKISINIGTTKDDRGGSVTLVQVNYGDK